MALYVEYVTDHATRADVLQGPVSPEHKEKSHRSGHVQIGAHFATRV